MNTKKVCIFIFSSLFHIFIFNYTNRVFVASALPWLVSNLLVSDITLVD